MWWVEAQNCALDRQFGHPPGDSAVYCEDPRQGSLASPENYQLGTEELSAGSSRHYSR
jgi:hypothetical protein